MFAYKMAVAIKQYGFHNIKIYNGGLTDWRRSGLPLESTEPLPEYSGPVITPEELQKKLVEVEKKQCREATGAPLLTLIDYRAAPRLHDKIGGDLYRIKTSCPIIAAQLDEFRQNKALIGQLPRKGLVVCLSETGKRDRYLQRYLYVFGFTNITSLETGMRGWIKAAYPVEIMKERAR